MSGIFFVNTSQKEQARVPVLFGGATLTSNQALRALRAQQNPVRIRRSKIDKLACQTESVRIFAEGEIPGFFSNAS